MSRNYDNWGRLVGAVMRREKDRQIALWSSFSSFDSADVSSRPSFASDVPAGCVLNVYVGGLSYIIPCSAAPLSEVYGSGMALVTAAEVCDAKPQLIASGEPRALHPVFQIYGRRQVFSGPAVTLKVFEDNVLIRLFLEEKGNERVLVVDGGGSLRCAILGGNRVVQAQNNGWAGIIVNGCIRNVNEINGCDIGVRALASHPMKANKKGIGEKHVPVNIAGTRICDGEWIYADADGILVSRTELSV